MTIATSLKNQATTSKGNIQLVDTTNNAGCTATTCPYCGVGCGVSAPMVKPSQVKPSQSSSLAVDLTSDESKASTVSAVKGLTEHPANFGKLCVKGTSLHETLSLDGRLLAPKIQGEEVDWPTAINTVADKIQSVIAEHGPDAVAFYGSGQLLTEDYYVANKLMKGFIGSGNMDTNSRLCMASAVAAYKRAFGSDTVPGCYDDIEQTDLLVLIGSNAAWAHPILFRRMEAAKQANPNLKIVVIDPRKTASCDIADLHLPIKAGTDTLLFNGLLAYLALNQKLDCNYIERHTENFEEALDLAISQSANTKALAESCNLELAELLSFFELFAKTDKTLSFYSQGVNQSASGTDKANAIINCHLATGRVGKVGASPLSITGQPNAMGGREVGGLANQLAAHMDFANPADVDRVKRFWQAPNIATTAGLKAVDLFNAVESGKVKFLWVMSTNPMVSMPDADRFKRALETCEMVVVSDCVEKTDTTAVADILLPAATWGEKDGTVTNSERRISRQRAFLPIPGKAKPDWWILTEVGKALGYAEQFNYQCPADIFAEHAALANFENNGSRDFYLGELANLSPDEYDKLAPIQWPVRSLNNVNNSEAREPTNKPDSQRMFGDGKFFTPSGRARFAPIHCKLPERQASEQYPFILNTGRIRDQWHTMTRTAKTSRLLQHKEQPYLDISPDDAKQLALASGDIVRVSNNQGELLLRTSINEGQTAGTVFAPMHWTGRYASKARVGVVIPPLVDPISGQPELKHAPVAISAYKAKWQGLLILANEPEAIASDYWSHSPFEQGHCYYLASDSEAREGFDALKTLLPKGEMISLVDSAAGSFRVAVCEADRLIGILFVSQHNDLPESQWLCSQFNAESIDPNQRVALLAGRPADASNACGKIICSCFGVAENTIRDAISAGASDVTALGKALQCGTNCGSCLPELRGLIAESAAQPEAVAS